VTDQEIVELYWKRDENAIYETDAKYRNYLFQIALNVLGNEEDSEETVNEAYFRTWNSIPTDRPRVLSTYIGKITRELAIDVYRSRHRLKRIGSEYAVSLEELAECSSGRDDTAAAVDGRLLADSIHAFLMTLTKEQRVVFVGRYYYLDSLKRISAYSGFSEAKVKTMLHRTRNRLRDYLRQEGLLQ